MSILNEDGTPVRALVVALLLSVSALAVRGIYFFRRGRITPPDSGTYLGLCEASKTTPLVLLTGDYGIEYAGFLLPFCGLTNLTGSTLPWVAVQILLGSVTAGLLFLSGRRLFSSRAGIVAGGLWVFVWDAFRWDVALLSDSVFVFAVALSIYALAYYRDEGTLRARAGVFATLALLTITRPFGGPLLVGWVLWNLLPDDDPRQIRLFGRKIAIGGAIVAIVVMVVVFSTRTAWASDHVLDVYRNGWIFWQGRNQVVVGSYAYTPTPAPTLPAFVVTNAAPIAVMGIIKTVTLFYPGPLYVRASPFWFAMHLASLLPAVVFGWIGIVNLVRNRHPSVSVVVTPIAVVTGIVALTFIDAGWRYRAPLLPALFLTAGYGVATNVRLIRCWDWVVRQGIRVLGTPPAPRTSPYRPDEERLHETVRGLSHDDLSEIAVYGYLHPMQAVRELFFARGHLVMALLDDPDRFVDVGCGPGLLLNSESGGIGVDIRPHVGRSYLDAVGDDSPIVAGTVTSIPLQTGSADAVVAMDMLEHISDLAHASDEIARVIDEDGQLLVCGPTENVIYELGRRFGGFSGADHKTTVGDIDDQLQANGWTRVKKRDLRIVFPLFSVFVYERRT